MQENQGPPSGRRLALGLLVWIFTSAGIGVATVAFSRSVATEWASDPHNLAIVITAEVYSILVASMLLIVGGGGRTKAALGLRSAGASGIVLGLGAIGVTNLIAIGGYAMANAVTPSDPSVLDIILGIGSDGGRLADAGPWSTAIIFVRVFVLVPLGEELLFRGAIFSWVRRRLSAWWTVGTTAALFAVIHQFPVILPYAFVWGVASGWVRERAGSVIPTIVAHCVNLVAIVVLSLVVSDWTATLPF